MRVERASLAQAPVRYALLFELIATAVGCARTPQAPEPSALIAPAPPSGASCNDPLPLSLGQVLMGTTRGSGDAQRPACARAVAPERIYGFHVDTRSQFRAVLQADFDAVIALRESCSYANAEIVCNDDARAGQGERSRIDVSLTEGDYYLIVDAARGGEGDFELFAYLEPIESAQHACEHARPLAFGETARGSTLGVPDRFQATCGHGAKAGEQVFELSVDEPSRLRIFQQTEYDGVLYLRDQCAEPVSELSCNDDFRGPHRSLVTARVPKGTYYLFTDGLEQPQGGTFSLHAERAVLSPTEREPAEVCAEASALPVQSGISEIDTFHAASHHAGSCGGRGAPEHVFAVEVSEPSRLRVMLRDPEFNAVVYVRERCLDPGSERACVRQQSVDRGNLPGQGAVHGLDLPVAPGSYQVFVDGLGEDDFGAAHVELDVAPVRELEALCESARELHHGDVVAGDIAARPSRFGARCGGEARGAEDVYALELSARALVTLELDSSFDGVLHVRRGCSDSAAEVGCNDDAGHTRRASLTELLEPGSYRVFVDAFGPLERGPYQLRAQLSAAP